MSPDLAKVLTKGLKEWLLESNNFGGRHAYRAIEPQPFELWALLAFVFYPIDKAEHQQGNVTIRLRTCIY